MQISWVSAQFTEAFLKLQRAKNLELEATKQYYEAYIESIARDNGLSDTTTANENKGSDNV